MTTRYISATAQTVTSVSGNVIKFAAGAPTHVPPEAIADVLRAGCTADGTEQVGDDATAQAAEVAASAAARATAEANRKLEMSDSVKGEVNAVPGATPGALIN